MSAKVIQDLKPKVTEWGVEILAIGTAGGLVGTGIWAPRHARELAAELLAAADEAEADR